LKRKLKIHKVNFSAEKFPFCEQFKKLVFEKRLVSTRLSTDYNVQWLATVKIHFLCVAGTTLPHSLLTTLSLCFSVPYKFLCSSFLCFWFHFMTIKIISFRWQTKKLVKNLIFAILLLRYFFSLGRNWNYNYVIYLLLEL
jgi:hypothetical protein